MTEDEVRPRRGQLMRRGVVHVVLFIPTSNPGEYLAVSQDGEPMSLFPGDKLRVDAVGPGQRLRFALPRRRWWRFT